MKYYRITNGLNAIGDFIKVTENPYNYVKTQDNDYYLSLYEYTEEQKNEALEIIEVEKKGKKYKRPRGVVGFKNVVTKKLVFDFDNEDDIESARQDTITAGERLKKFGISELDMKVSFSGGKGFSIVVDHDTELTPEQHKAIAKKIAGDLKTFDTTVYNANRIFRVDYTKHNKTGLYKTPLFFQNLKTLDVDKIKNMAKNKKQPKFKTKSVELPKELTEVQVKEKSTKETPGIKNENFTIDFSKKPYYLTDVKYVLHKGFIPKGYGNMGMMILAATYKHVGFDKTDAYHMLKGVNEKRSEIYQIEKRDNEEIWNEVVETVYNPEWKGGTYDIEENDLLQKIAKEYQIHESAHVTNIDGLGNKFLNFADNINKNIIKTGIKSLDDSVMITTGMMVGLLGAPSSGKSSFATKFVENLSKRDQNVLFLSLDMTDNLLYQRLLQRTTKIDIAKKLRKMIKDDPNYDKTYKMSKDPEIIEGSQKLGETYKNVDFNSNRGVTIESIEDNIKASKAKYGENLKLVVVDYLEKVRGPYSDSTANSGYIASRLSDLASTYEVCILLLLQPQKSAGDPSEELLSMRKVKGASVIEQDARMILTVWRPGFSPKDSTNDKYASIAIVKNNMGEVKQLDFGWNGLEGDYSELTQVEKDYLESLRQQIKEEKEGDKKKGWDI